MPQVPVSTSAISLNRNNQSDKNNVYSNSNDAEQVNDRNNFASDTDYHHVLKKRKSEHCGESYLDFCTYLQCVEKLEEPAAYRKRRADIDEK
jgi:hypothetical protein